MDTVSTERNERSVVIWDYQTCKFRKHQQMKVSFSYYFMKYICCTNGLFNICYSIYTFVIQRKVILCREFHSL